MSANVHAVDSRGWTALHHAVEQGDQSLVSALVKSGAYLGARTNMGNIPLHMAARSGRADLFSRLTTTTNQDLLNRQGYTPLQEALMFQHWWPASILVAHGSSPYGPDNTPSLSSLDSPSSDSAVDPGLLLKALLADPGPTGLVAQALRWRGAYGRTSLHIFASSPAVWKVTNLLNARADKEALDDFGASPLYLAAAAGHAELVPLLATPAVINKPVTVVLGEPRPGGAPYYLTPLIAAAGGGHVETVEALLAAGAEPDYPDDHDGPLAAAVDTCNMQVVPALLKALASKCLQQEKQGAQQQQQGGPNNHHQQQQHHHQGGGIHQQQQQQQQQGQGGVPLGAAVVPAEHGRPKLICFVAKAVSIVVTELANSQRCAQLLGMVIDELGPEVAGLVCQELQQQSFIKAGYLPPGSVDFRTFWQTYRIPDRDHSYLAEALLLGWLQAENRRRIPARLQRLVPGVGGVTPVQQQQQQPEGHMQQQQDEWPDQLMEEAILAAVHGMQEQAAAVMGDCAELYWYLHPSNQGGADDGGAHNPAGSSLPADAVPDPVQQQPPSAAATSQGLEDQQTEPIEEDVPPLLVHAGLMAAIRTQQQRWVPGMTIDEYPAHWYTAGQVQGAFLSAWVAARGGGRHELVAAVVAAVKAAQRQQQQQE